MINQTLGVRLKQSIALVTLIVLTGGLILACNDSEGSDKTKAEQNKPPRKSEARPALDGKKQGPPPAVVVLGEITSGKAEPISEFVGTFYYTQSSKLASEVAGKVNRVLYSEGQDVKAGQALVRLGSGLLDKTIAGVRASNEQAGIELERAIKDFDRMNRLYNSGSVSESVYDDHFFRLRGQEKSVESLKAQLGKLELEKRKMTIGAPFDGVIMEKTVEKGEWVPVGGTVAVIAGTSEIEAIVEVPAETLEFLKRGREVEVMGLGRKLKGRFTSFVPRGDVATRTFSVKVSLRNPGGIVEGMEARVFLPTGGNAEGLLVSRDAVISKMGMDVVYIAAGGVAKKVPVRVLGYRGFKARVTGPGLAAGMKVITKGNERIMFDGQPLKEVDAPSPGNMTEAAGGTDMPKAPDKE